MDQDLSAPADGRSASTVLGLFDAAQRAQPDRSYCASAACSLTYAQAAGAIRTLANQLGPSVAGRTVALVLPNGPAFLVAYYAALAAGAAPALVNHAHPDATVDALLSGLDVAAVLSDRQIPGLAVTPFDDAAVAGLVQGPGPTAFPTPDGASGIAAILFSGGTTGLPKQVAHSDAAVRKMIDLMEWGWPTQEAEVWLPVAPFTHVWGFLMGVLNPVLRAGSLVIPPRFHPDIVVDMLQDQGVTIFGGGPPAIYQALMASSRFADARFPKLRVCPGGGAPFPVAVHRRWGEATGLRIAEGYGMTEIAPISVNTALAGMKPGAAGKPVPETVIEVVDIQTGTQVLPAGETGEIRVKGPHMMPGYVGNPEETAIALREGFVYTGDIGMLDQDGFLVISDRKKDVIFVKGFNVFPREIEECLLAHPAVSGVCVVGRSDDRAGETPVAFVTLRETAATGDLADHCARLLTPYKQPSDIVVLDSLPLTPAGKVDRSALRARAGGQA